MIPLILAVFESTRGVAWDELNYVSIMGSDYCGRSFIRHVRL